MYPLDALDGLDLDDHLRLDEQVETESQIDDHRLVSNGKGLLGLNPQTPLLELVPETRLVYGFEKARTEFTMHVDRSSDDRLGQLIDFHYLCDLRVLCVKQFVAQHSDIDGKSRRRWTMESTAFVGMPG